MRLGRPRVQGCDARILEALYLTAPRLGITRTGDVLALPARDDGRVAHSSTVRVLHERAAPEGLPAGTVTFLLADVEGSLRLWETDPDAAGLAIKRLNLIVDEISATHNGVRPVEQGEGDSFVIAFEHADDAAACAVALQLAFAGEAWAGGLHVRTRIALHTGKAELRDEGNYVGSAISRCGRLRSLAHGGQTLISATTYELVSDALPPSVTARDLGLHEIRDVERPLRIYQLDHPDLDQTFPPLRSLEVLTHNLPRQLTSFVGREAELRDVEALLTTNKSRLVTLTGPGGCGKTRLALRVAERAAENFPDGIWFTDLASVREDSAVAEVVAETVGGPTAAAHSAEQKLRDQLRPRRALVILDNCEQVIEGCAALADDLLRHCTGLTIVATSREPLRVEGETQWRVPSMTAPGVGDTGAIATLEAYDAVKLFIERAVRARANFAVTNETAPAVAQICQQLDGLPLAIELAAARVRLLSPDEIARSLSDRFRLLHGGARSARQRQQTLAASVDWSYDLLDERERILLRRLHVFRGGFTLTAAEDVCAGEGLDGIERVHVLDLLAALVDKSLVVSGQGNDGPDGRYRLLETIRLYASQRARDAGEVDIVERRHAEAFCAFARRAMDEVVGPNQLQWLTTVDAQYENLRTALDWAVRNGDGAIGLSFVASLGNFWNVRGHWQEGLRWIDKLRPFQADASEGLRRIVEFVEAGLRAMCGDVESAIPVMQRVAERATAEEKHFAAAWAYNQLAKYGSVSDGVTARGYFERGVDAARKSGRPAILADTLSYWAWRELSAADTDRAVALADEARQVAKEGGDVRSSAVALLPRSVAALRVGDIGLARSLADEAVALATELAEPFILGSALLVLNEVALLSGDHDRARRLVDEAMRVTADMGAHYLAADEIFRGRLAYFDGDVETAVDLFSRSVGKRDPMVTAGFIFRRGLVGPPEWLIAAGHLDEARAVITETRALAAAADNQFTEAHLDFADALLKMAERDRLGAESVAHRALATFARAKARAEVIRTLKLLADLALVAESATEAARLMGAALAAQQDMGLVLGTIEQRSDAELEKRIRSALGDSYERAAGEGAGLSLEEAVAYAIRGRGERKRPAAGWESLTPTELDVVRLVATGATNREIGDQLFVSPNTIKSHLAHVFAKLGVANRAELSRVATERGLTTGG